MAAGALALLSLWSTACGESTDARTLTVVGSLCAPDGEPIASALVRVRAVRPHQSEHEAPHEAITTESGAFSLQFDRGVDERVCKAVQVSVVTTDSVRAGSSRELATVEVPASDDPDSVLDVGALVVTPPPLLAAGTVITSSDRPVAGAIVEMRRVPLPWYASDQWPVAKTDSDGRFVLRGDSLASAGDEFELRVHSGGRTSEPVAFEPGAEGLAVVATPAGSVSGTITGLPPDMNEAEVSIRLRPVADPESGRGQPAETSAKGWPEGTTSLGVESLAFAAQTVRPGLYDVDMLVGWGAKVLVRTIPGVRIAGGSECDDLRLEGIDVWSSLHKTTVTIEPADGRPLHHAVVHTRVPNPPRTVRTRPGVRRRVARRGRTHGRAPRRALGRRRGVLRRARREPTLGTVRHTRAGRLGRESRWNCLKAPTSPRAPVSSMSRCRSFLRSSRSSSGTLGTARTTH